MEEARYYQKLDQQMVRCTLCPQNCLIRPGKYGACRARINQGGKLYTRNYAQVASLALDPIEKKPLYHFHPGRDILSLGTNGCNLHCLFCQNWQISQEDAPTRKLAPEAAVARALEYGSLGIAYTYSEPLIWFEYVVDTARLAKEAGLVNVLVTNGLINPQPLEELLPYIDAMNIDLKSMEEGFYRKYCQGPQAPVLETIRRSFSACHIEITNLLIPGLNDGQDTIRRLIDWVAELSPDIPLHFSRYFPHYKLSLPPTPAETLLWAAEEARHQLHFVYLGNFPDPEYSTTFCPGCKAAVIRREGYWIKEVKVKHGQCTLCGTSIPVVGT